MSRAEGVTIRRRALDDPEEIAELVRSFYREVAQDELLGPVFNDVAQVDWAAHLPKLTAFWCRTLLGQAGYSGNAFIAHRRLNEHQPFTTGHFERWLTLFEDAVDARWTGVNAQRAKTHARFVAHAHQRKLANDTAGDRTRRTRQVQPIPGA